MIGALLRRSLEAAITALGAVLLVSILLDLVPGDPIDALLGEQAIETDRAALRASLGLDEPLPVRLALFARDVATLQLRTSVPPFQDRVFEKIGRALPKTALLAGVALALALLVAFPLGVLAALRPGGRVDAAASSFAVAGAATPRIWLGPLLILLFALKLDWLPVSGLESPASIVLPAVTLGTALAAFLARMIRASLLDTIGEDYVRTARAKGLPERVVVLKHALRPALLPVLTIVGLQLGGLLAGAVVTEKVFNYPGLGTLLLGAIDRRDYNLVRACVLTLTLGYVAVNLLTDVAYGLADPRVRGRS